MQSPSLRFAATVQALAQTARGLGLAMPGFRTPPRLAGVHRSIKRRTDGATVAVVVKDRPWPAVQADMVEGVIAANGLASPAADQARAKLWSAIAAHDKQSEAAPSGTRKAKDTAAQAVSTEAA